MALGLHGEEYLSGLYHRSVNSIIELRRPPHENGLLVFFDVLNVYNKLLVISSCIVGRGNSGEMS